MIKSGHLYLFESYFVHPETYETWTKMGKTTQKIKDRIIQLETGLPGGIKNSRAWFFDNINEVEKYYHKKGINVNYKEWFPTPWIEKFVVPELKVFGKQINENLIPQKHKPNQKVWLRNTISQIIKQFDSQQQAEAFLFPELNKKDNHASRVSAIKNNVRKHNKIKEWEIFFEDPINIPIIGFNFKR